MIITYFQFKVIITYFQREIFIYRPEFTVCHVIFVSVLHLITGSNEATSDASAVQKRTLTIMPSIAMHQEQV